LKWVGEKEIKMAYNQDHGGLVIVVDTNS